MTRGGQWGILVYENVTDQLMTIRTENHNNRAVQGSRPLLVLNVWNHAYYPVVENGPNPEVTPRNVSSPSKDSHRGTATPVPDFVRAFNYCSGRMICSNSSPSQVGHWLPCLLLTGTNSPSSVRSAAQRLLHLTHMSRRLSDSSEVESAGVVFRDTSERFTTLRLTVRESRSAKHTTSHSVPHGRSDDPFCLLWFLFIRFN